MPVFTDSELVDIFHQRIKEIYAITKTNHASLKLEVSLYKRLDGSLYQLPESKWYLYAEEYGNTIADSYGEGLDRLKHLSSAAALLDEADALEARAKQLRDLAQKEHV